jgi:hypothetical protein
MALVTGGTSSRRATRPAGPPVSASSTVPAAVPALSTSARASAPAAGEQVCFFVDASRCFVPADYVWYVPMWPFADYAAARQWQRVDGPAGHAPWHADATMTTQLYVQKVLGFSDLNVITSRRITTDQAHIGIGYRDVNGGVHTAAVVHLVRYERYAGERGTGWEIVGTDDTTFSLEMPTYGASVPSPVTAGGRVSGVDESIRLWVRSLDRVVGSSCCVPAGGERRPWSAQLSFQAAPGTALTVVAATGGHLQAHERFALQGFTAGR